MAKKNEITVPDIGGAVDVDVIEILVKEGDQVEKETSLITLESDKASMEIPSPRQGTIKSLSLKVGDKVSEGDVILTLEDDDTQSDIKEPNQNNAQKTDSDNKTSKSQPTSHEEKLQSVNVPDIGGAQDVEVIEILVSDGDEINKEDSIVTLESDKASMEIPAPAAGKIESIALKVGDKVSEGDLILQMISKDINNGEETPKKDSESSVSSENKEIESADGNEASVEKAYESVPGKQPITESSDVKTNDTPIHAGPAVRRLAREFGVSLNEVQGSGRKSRITKEDVQKFVKGRLQDKSVSGGMALPPAPKIDFSKFGEINYKPLNKIKRLTGENVHRSWINIPHVTQFDEADITELEAFRNQEKEQAKSQGYKLTILAFVCKAIVKALQEYPEFNTSLDPNGEQLIYKNYFNIGVAVDTPNGLVVPVIKGVDKLSISEIAKEMGRLSQKARDKGLMPGDMNGGCFTISSLGGIGGTAFTPIVNAPEVAILGLSRSELKPVYHDGSFVPRLKLPLSLSYDHRVIDGAQAAKFTRFLADCLGDIRKIIL